MNKLLQGQWINAIASRMSRCDFRLLTAALILADQCLVSPAYSQAEKWRPVGESSSGTVYVDTTSKKSIASVEYRSVIYKRGDFSFSTFGGMTERKRFVFDCPRWAYKPDDTAPAYFGALEWVTPFDDTKSVERIALKELCGDIPSPWRPIGESTVDNVYYINSRTVFDFLHPLYGRVYYGVLVSGRDSSSVANFGRLYWSCSKRTIAAYDNRFPPLDSELLLEDPNPNSMGQAWVKHLCESFT